MIFKSCHIEGFGNIHNKDYSFESGLNPFFLENGAGKSTLAEFLCAMLFGLPTTNARTSGKELSRRERYFPFEGGVYGGTLILSDGENEYRIERVFDRIRQPSDRIKYAVNGTVIAPSKEPGELLFGVDEDAFRRTVFIRADELDLDSGDSLAKRLNATLALPEGTVDYEKAHEKLENAALSIRKKRGATGELDRTEEEIRILKMDIERTKVDTDRLADLYKDYNRTQDQLKELKWKLSLAEQEEHWATYDSLVKRAKESRAVYEGLSVKYPKGLPDSQHLAEMAQAMTDLDKKKAEVAAASLNEEERARYNDLKSRFENRNPDADLNVIGSLIPNLEILRAQTKAGCCQTERETETLNRFENKEVTEAELAKLDSAADKVRIAEEALRNAPISSDIPAYTPNEKAEPKKKKSVLPIAILSGIGLVAGIVLLAMSKLIPGIVLIVLGLVGVIATLALWVKGMVTGNGTVLNVPQVPSANAETERLRAALEMAKAELAAPLARLGYHSEDGVLADLKNLKRDLAEYEETRINVQKRKELFQESLLKIEVIEQKINVLFAQYKMDPSGDYSSARSALSKAILEYQSLCKKTVLGKKLIEELQERELQLLGLVVSYPREGEESYRALLVRLTADSKNGENLRMACIRDEAEAKRFANQYHLTERPEASGTAPDELKREMNIRSGEIQKIEMEIRNLENERSRIPEYEKKIIELSERSEMLESKYELIQKADAYLTTAQNNLNSRYIDPIRDCFDSYYDLVGKMLGKKITLSPNFEMRIEVGGSQKDIRHLSLGEQTAVLLCLRIALCDSLYKDNNMPPIILDDPLVHLDEGHLVKAKQMISSLAENRQILCFTCHESRQIGA